MSDRSRENSKDEHMHLSDAVLESVMVFRLGAGAVAEVVVPLCLAKAGFLSGCTVVYLFILYTGLSNFHFPRGFVPIKYLDVETRLRVLQYSTVRVLGFSRSHDAKLKKLKN